MLILVKHCYNKLYYNKLYNKIHSFDLKLTKTSFKVQTKKHISRELGLFEENSKLHVIISKSTFIQKITFMLQIL